MDKLTDIEICKSLAEIEGVELGLIGFNCFDGMYKLDSGSWTYYNPLDDGDMCLGFIIKYRLAVIPNDRENKFTVTKPGTNARESDENLKRAVCLCIIELHKDT